MFNTRNTEDHADIRDRIDEILHGMATEWKIEFYTKIINHFESKTPETSETINEVLYIVTKLRTSSEIIKDVSKKRICSSLISFDVCFTAELLNLFASDDRSTFFCRPPLRDACAVHAYMELPAGALANFLVDNRLLCKFLPVVTGVNDVY